MATPQAERPLRGRRILVCRPEPEATRLAGVLEQMGADVRLLPMMEREPLPETPEQRSTLQQLDNFHHVVAVSPYAARRLLEEIDHWWPQMPSGIQWYGVGEGTAAVFREHGLDPQRPEQGWTSEALLKHPSLQNLRNEKVLLARGEQGRELLRQTLAERGARITTLPLYRRSCPYYPSEKTEDIFARFRPDVVIALSGETLNNLVSVGAGYLDRLAEALIVIPVERVAALARSLGLPRTFVPDSLANDELALSVASRLTQDALDNG